MTFKLHIQDTLQKLLAQEDTDGDKKITIEDKGPKRFTIHSEEGDAEVIESTYHLSNLLQELVIQKQQGKTIADIELSKIKELPAHRISRMIKDYYWDGLTRHMDKTGISALVSDTKNDSLTAEILPVYVPASDDLASKYYRSLEAEYPIKMIQLPAQITPEFVKSINNEPGILSLKLETVDGQIKGVPFVVPGGRFNEMYGWDSYFESVGLLCDGRVDLAKAMADNFQYQIEHYGKILNANRSYYLTRTQPPFYSSLISEIYDLTKDKDWLKSHLKTCIHEYESVWMVQGKRLTSNGLNRYFAEGIGITPESEEGHYDAVLQPYLSACDLPLKEFIEKYTNDEVSFKELNDYFLHDRTVRESGHDTSYRLEGICAHLNLVELNAMLYKYETDFANLIEHVYDGKFYGYETTYWKQKAENRKKAVNTYLWNESQGLYFDYNVETKAQTDFVAATSLTPLWAELCTKEQAESLVKNAIRLLKEKGGIAGSTKESRGDISRSRPQRQWDYPNGWAPHQMLIWKGLQTYGFEQELQELVYRWLYMITRNAVDYNGTIPEKYDVVAATHKVFAEYGNVGTEFEYITQEGFGWMNASYQYGLTLLKDEFVEALNQLKNPEALF